MKFEMESIKHDAEEKVEALKEFQLSSIENENSSGGGRLSESMISGLTINALKAAAFGSPDVEHYKVRHVEQQ